MLAFAAAYATLAGLTNRFLVTDGIASIVWPPGGLALAGLLLAGIRFWPAILLGDLSGNFLMGFHGWSAVLGAMAATLEATLAAVLIAQLRDGHPPLTRLRQYLWLCLSAALASLVGATLGTTVSMLNGSIVEATYFRQLILWWQGDVLGMVVLTPMILVWRHPPTGWLTQPRLLETLLCFGLAAIAGQIIFMGWLHEQFGEHAKGFLSFAFVAWASVRFGRHGASLVVGLTAAQALAGIMHGQGYLGQLDLATNLTNYWFFILVLTLVGMSLAMVINERLQAETDLKEREQRLRAMVELSPLGMARNAMDGRYMEANPALLDMVGYSLTELNQLSYWDLTPAHYAPVEQQQLKSLEVQGRYGPYEKEYIHRDGHLLPVRLNGVLITGNEGERYIWSIIEDISERKRAEEEMQLASLVYTNSSEAMSVSDADNVILAINPAFAKLTGYSKEEAIGKKTSILRSGRHDLAFYESMWETIRQTGHWHGEVWERRKNGEQFIVLLTINTILNEDGSVHRRVAQFLDISEKKKSEELIWLQANFDPLTGLPNRHMFLDRLQQEIKKAHRTGLPLALIFLDLDHFKEVNDTLGHAMGDQLLKEVAARLTSSVRETDTVVRLGGDEFTLILSELEDTHIVERVARKLLDRLVEPFKLGEDLTYVSASIGITFYPDDAADIDSLIKHADQAMYAAKQQGRNRYNYFTHSMQLAVEKRMRLANDLRGAVAGQQFSLYYQPIVELVSGQVHKAEALIRWEHPKLGRISPADFIPIAEETGLIIDIGNWVFFEAARQVKQWRLHYHPDFQISINKSPVQFRSDAGHDSLWISHLATLGLPGHSMVVEITEGLLMDIGDVVSQHLLAFRDAGIQVALDDFGTGYSALSYLKKFDIDYLKIDQSFVRNLAIDSPDLALCEAIIVMAHKLGIKVVAEGVETTLQRDLLARAGCDYVQGYLYACPLSSNEFEHLLSQDAQPVTDPSA